MKEDNLIVIRNSFSAWLYWNLMVLIDRFSLSAISWFEYFPEIFSSTIFRFWGDSCSMALRTNRNCSSSNSGSSVSLASVFKRFKLSEIRNISLSLSRRTFSRSFFRIVKRYRLNGLDSSMSFFFSQILKKTFWTTSSASSLLYRYLKAS